MQGQSLVQDSQRVSTGLSLTQSELVTDFDQLKVMILTYDTTIYNYTTVNTYTTLIYINKTHKTINQINRFMLE